MPCHTARSACTRETARTSECKATCSSCEELRSAIRQDTGLQVRLVAHLSPCTDLHPSCGTWVRQDKCSREPRLMLELCQVRAWQLDSHMWLCCACHVSHAAAVLWTPGGEGGCRLSLSLQPHSDSAQQQPLKCTADDAVAAAICIWLLASC